MYFRGHEDFRSEWSLKWGAALEEPVRGVVRLILVEMLFHVVILNYREI